MHITSHPSTSIHIDNEDRLTFNVIAFDKLMASSPNPFNAVQAAIRIEDMKNTFNIKKKELR